MQGQCTIRKRGCSGRYSAGSRLLRQFSRYYKKYPELSLSEPVEAASNENPDITMEGNLQKASQRIRVEQESDVEQKSDVYNINQNDGTSPKGALPAKERKRDYARRCK